MTASQPRKTLFGRLRERLNSGNSFLSRDISELLSSRKAIDAELLEELETQLLLADVGVEATRKIVDYLSARIDRHEINDADAVHAALRDVLLEILQPLEQPLSIDNSHRPHVILVTGVNGAGKTTTIGKLASRLQRDGRSVMLAAADTFRAAAIEQLQAWGERNNVPVIAQRQGADPASVAHDAIHAAMSRNTDVLLIDTAGRLHTQEGLMDELAKTRRVLQKQMPDAPHETLLVIDASTGQNALLQAQQFNAKIPLTGLILTKLDGSAKGGVILALAERLSLPLRYIGIGEAVDDLVEFSAADFVAALMNPEPHDHI